jgi:hypothetical protein
VNTFKNVRIYVGIFFIVLAISGCVQAGGQSESSKLSNPIAEELHAIQLPGFAFSEVQVQDGNEFQIGARTDASFFATPNSQLTRVEDCEALIAWANANLDNFTTFAQYNAMASGLGIATQACRFLPNNSFPGFRLAGTYKHVLIQIVPQGNSYLINIDSYGATLADVPAEIDPNIAATSALLSAISEARGSEARYLMDSEMQAVWENFMIPVEKMTADWIAADDGTVRQIHLAFGNTGLLPFCMDIGPWNTENAGADPGANYLVLLVENFASVRNFGLAVSGECD